MSSRPTPISNDIYNFLLENYSSEDEFLRQLKLDAAKEGIPEICISPEQGKFLQFFLKAINAKYVVEIGSLAGYSAITMARALPEDGKLIAVEMNKKHADFIERKVEEAGLEKVIEVVNQDGKSFYESYNPDYELDFVFIDADKRGYVNYMNKSTPLLRKGGILCADNALAFGYIAGGEPEEDKRSVEALRDFNQQFLNNKNYDHCLATLGDGMAMGVKI